MSSVENFVNNIRNFAIKNKLDNYQQIADALDVNVNTLKSWMCMKRSPSLKMLDSLGDSLGIETYKLISKNYLIRQSNENLHNDSRLNFVNNLDEIFVKCKRNTWNDKHSLIFGMISIDCLKSYYRKTNHANPTLEKIDEIANSLGIPPNELIRRI